MNTRSVNSAASVIHAALKQCQTAAGIALALESAGLLMSPEAARDMASVSTDAVGVAERAVGELKREHDESARLRNRVDEVERAYTFDVADLRRQLDKVHDELTGTNLSLYEEEQETARLRLALKSAQRGRREQRELVRQMVDGLNGYDCPPPNEAPLDTVTRWSGYLSESEARVAELEAERHSTNEALADVTVALRKASDRP